MLGKMAKNGTITSRRHGSFPFSFTEKINTSDVFFRGGGKKKLDVFFPAKKAVDVSVFGSSGK